MPPPQDAALAAAHQMRATARDIFLHALAETSIARAFDQHVEFSRGVLRIADDLFDLDRYARTLVIAIGKAAHTMLAALTARMGMMAQGIVAAPSAPPAQTIGFRYFQGGHPLPNDESWRAAGAILRALHSLDERGLVIYLLSGGGSAIVEKAVDDDISLADIVATHRALVHSSAPIAEINAIRKHLSAVKGGRMAAAAAPAQQVSVMVSDVPEHALDALASGPTMPDSTTVEDCYRVAQQHSLLSEFPASVRELFEKRALEETPKKDHPAFHNARWWPILTNVAAQKAAAAEAARNGFAVEVDNTCDDWDYLRAADYLLDRLRTLRQGVSRACLISGGEVTVRVKDGGTGGRNQQFALYCAQKIAGENIAVLSAGTDGIDGNSTAAGAVADGSTLARAQAAEHDVAVALARFNAFPLFERIGDAVVTGPTGNNVRDLRILLAY
jgi:hydroxypyruvate reductase